MIRRLFYMALGAFGAVWTMRKLQALHPNHVARRAVRNASGLLEQARDIAGTRGTSPPGGKPSCGPASGSTLWKTPITTT
nr:hypothetical protein GCM10020093_030620 [Planobispora longispora]